MKILLLALAVLAMLLLLAAYLCYRKAFYVPRKQTLNPRVLLSGEQYQVFAEQTLKMIDETLALPFEEVTLLSHDGLRLFGRYYETAKGAPLKIMFHGYRSMAQRDFSGGLKFALESGFNALLVDQRAHGKSEGRFLSFGIREKQDCLSWVNYAVQRFGTSVQILLSGISMGAATVLMASDLDLPENVKGIIGDCGYSSPSEIIKKVISDMRLPVRSSYFLLNLGARLFGHLHLENGATKALRNTKIPVLLLHGEDDRFVPCEMSQRMYEACASEKTLVTFPNAGHGLSYMVNEERYKTAVRQFTQRALT